MFINKSKAPGFFLAWKSILKQLKKVLTYHPLSDIIISERGTRKHGRKQRICVKNYRNCWSLHLQNILCKRQRYYTIMMKKLIVLLQKSPWIISGAFIVSAYFNYFIIYSPAQSFRRGYTHIHLFSAVFERIFLASQSE